MASIHSSSLSSSTSTSTSIPTPPSSSARPGFRLYLCDLQEEMCKAWRKSFAQHVTRGDVQIVHGRFESVAEYDCIVSPGNSFGLMDGGMDAALTAYFGPSLQKHVQQHIIDTYDGEQSVGTCFIINTGHHQYQWLAHAPTMRVPYNICGTDNVYRAMKSILRAVYDHNQTQEHKIRSLVCTGLGTFYGRVPPSEAARQMHLAYEAYLSPPTTLTWSFASQRQHAVRYGGYDAFVRAHDELKESILESESSRHAIADDMHDYQKQIKDHINK